jgi:hypothetical protein
MGNAGEASQMSWSNAGVAASELADALVATAPTSVVMLAMGSVHMTVGMMVVRWMVLRWMVVGMPMTLRVPVAAVGATLGFKSFIHGVHNQVHRPQHVSQHCIGFNFEVIWF